MRRTAGARSSGRWCAPTSCLTLSTLLIILLSGGNAWWYFSRQCSANLAASEESAKRALEHLDGAEKQLLRFQKDRTKLQKEVEQLSASLQSAQSAEYAAAKARRAGGSALEEEERDGDRDGSGGSRLTGHEQPGRGNGMPFPDPGGPPPGLPMGMPPMPQGMDAEKLKEEFEKFARIASEKGMWAPGGERVPLPGQQGREQQLVREDEEGGGRASGLRGGDQALLGRGGKGQRVPLPAVTRKPLTPYPLTLSQQAVYAALSEGSQDGDEVEPAPRAATQARALVIICYNRADYLRRTLAAVLAGLPRYNRPHIYVSQDGRVEEVSSVIREFADVFKKEAQDVPYTHLQHPAVAPQTKDGGAPAAWAIGYYKLSAHFKWALDKLFVEKKHPRVIVLEDDLEIAPDFFDYFSAVEPLLDSDDQLLAASAWSDLGQPSFVADPRQVLRSDFFPGLGWMLTSHAWEELGPKWPEAFWDDWLREPQQRQGRHFLRPEVSRSYTFGESGVSQAQFFAQYLATLHLNKVRVDWASEDLSYLSVQAWDADLRAAVRGATPFPDVQSHFAQSCAGVSPSGDTTGLDMDGVLIHADFEAQPHNDAPAGLPSPLGTDSVLIYNSEDGYRSIAAGFGFIDDIKAHIPRSAYKGVTVIKHKGCRKLLVSQEAATEMGR